VYTCFFTHGNGGYDVGHDTLDLSYRSTAPVQTVPAVVTVQARATRSLSRFDLDVRGDSWTPSTSTALLRRSAATAKSS
jgi:hypothetical protein